MSDFITMVTRIVTELRRSNLVTETKAAINDAIEEAAKTPSTLTRCTLAS